MNDLRCPLCKQPLYTNSQGMACDNRHQFDRAKEGYFNLLPVQHKNSREPGDAKEQLLARRQFLEAGFFGALKQDLQALMPKQTQTLLDIGCGEGYFTRGFAEVLPQAQVYGIDIAKAGVRLAAKSAQDKNRHVFAVASSFDLPFADHSMDVITRIYAPSKDAELWRVIKPEGLLVIVTPADTHLLELRRRIYKDVRAHQHPSAPAGFVACGQHRLQGDLIVDSPALCAALLAMTPFAWRLPEALQAEIVATGIKDSFDFMISLYRRS
ncbi:putative RNA methyltransferase [Cellvibrio sp. UBA7661]|uniref:putative RNA methyltransferase n=1 Tax=Cellvibrio sp. UBA7661 TaxID=1946311 RepID=UPI002F35ED7C